ncbi:LCP family protein [Streptomyces sp. V1I6]|uniref:LCP family protein n=1 Tax=Streptomyces sp. V1I6 TaxID=3042273 RepID=UPI0027820DAA|nr:LCP family protein [Streptomyces sp. V1I6]MDQ0844819.1 LCP family protein required for cell wall assembly [Streptomyces sp. V1I6]
MPASERWWRSRKVLRRLGLGVALLFAVTAGAGWFLYQRLDENVRTDEAAARALAADHDKRPRQTPGRAQNILLIGSDKEANWGSERSDTAVLLHLSADRSRASLVSVPRDLMVDIPRCLRPDGSRSTAQYAPFNWAFQFGGAACAVRTFEDLSGVRVDHHLVLDFSGFGKVVDAVGGVEVNVSEKVHEPEYRITLQPGTQVLRGRRALVFVRTRVGVGDGSDLQRVERQKQFMLELLKKVQREGVLTNPAKLYRLADAATSSLTADPGLDSPAELYSLASGASGIQANSTQILTVPSVEHPEQRGRYAMVEDQGEALFRAIRDDRPLPKVYNAYESDPSGRSFLEGSDS